MSILKNEGSRSQTDVVLANAAAAIQVFEQEKNLEECVAIARESILSGKAFASLKKVTKIG